MSTTDASEHAQPQTRALNKDDYKTLGLSSLGGTLEFYDFVIYALYAKQVIEPLFLPNSMASFTKDIIVWGMFAAGYFARPIGGIVMAHFGDKTGRKRMFTLSVAMMALPTFAIGLLPTYATAGLLAPLLLLVMRIFQGAAIGGEMPGAWTFIAEHTPPQRYGLGIGILTSGITGGIMLGFLVFIIVSMIFTHDEIMAYAWRIPFLIGGVFGIISVYLRRFLQETPIFKEMAAAKKLAKEIPLVTVFKKHKVACLIVALLTWSLSTTVMVGILLTPSFVIGGTNGFGPMHGNIAGCMAAFTLSIGCVLFGWLEDKAGTRNTMIVCWGGLAITALYFYGTISKDMSFAHVLFNYGLMGLFTGSIAMTPIVGTRAFPPSVRYSGLSSSYNITYAVLSFVTPTAFAYYYNPTHILGQYSYWAPGLYIAGVAILAVIVGFFPMARRGWTSEVKLNLHNPSSITATRTTAP